MNIYVKPKDSPKIYALVRDIYGDPLGIEATDLIKFTYSVYQVTAGTRYPVEGFVGVDIQPSNYYPETQTYPENIQGLSTIERAEGYNVEVFPYKTGSTTISGHTVWESPFTEQGVYELVVDMSYLMNDVALEGTSVINKTFSVQVRVEE